MAVRACACKVLSTPWSACGIWRDRVMRDLFNGQGAPRLLEWSKLPWENTSGAPTSRACGMRFNVVFTTASLVSYNIPGLHEDGRSAGSRHQGSWARSEIVLRRVVSRPRCRSRTRKRSRRKGSIRVSFSTNRWVCWWRRSRVMLLPSIS